jgi:hypothetical protein
MKNSKNDIKNGSSSIVSSAVPPRARSITREPNVLVAALTTLTAVFSVAGLNSACGPIGSPKSETSVQIGKSSVEDRLKALTQNFDQVVDPATGKPLYDMTSELNRGLADRLLGSSLDMYIEDKNGKISAFVCEDGSEPKASVPSLLDRLSSQKAKPGARPGGLKSGLNLDGKPGNKSENKPDDVLIADKSKVALKGFQYDGKSLIPSSSLEAFENIDQTSLTRYIKVRIVLKDNNQVLSFTGKVKGEFQDLDLDAETPKNFNLKARCLAKRCSVVAVVLSEANQKKDASQVAHTGLLFSFVRSEEKTKNTKGSFQTLWTANSAGSIDAKRINRLTAEEAARQKKISIPQPQLLTQPSDKAAAAPTSSAPESDVSKNQLKSESDMSKNDMSEKAKAGHSDSKPSPQAGSQVNSGSSSSDDSRSKPRADGSAPSSDGKEEKSPALGSDWPLP